jgi:hypothetical protein
MWTSLKKAISFVDKLRVLYTTESTTTFPLSTKGKPAATTDQTKKRAKSFQQGHGKFSSFQKPAYTLQLKTKTSVPHKSTSSTCTTPYCIYNI